MEQLLLPNVNECDCCKRYDPRVEFFQTNCGHFFDELIFEGGIFLCSYCSGSIPEQNPYIKIITFDKNDIYFADKLKFKSCIYLCNLTRENITISQEIHLTGPKHTVTRKIRFK